MFFRCSLKHWPLQSRFILRLFLVLALCCAPVLASASNFITTWKTDNPGDSNDNQITIPTNGNGYNYEVDWGDGTSDAGITGNITHTYAAPGIYTVTISGDFRQIFFNDEGDKEKILSVEQWGDIEWRAMNRTFHGCINLAINATDAPDLSGVTNMNLMFSDTTFNDDIGHWDVSTITHMSTLFADNPNFNQDLNDWKVDNVTTMSSMFFNATSFNGDISDWKTGKVENMTNMFHTASAFNQDITQWNTENVTDMRNTFFRAASFNQDIGGWEVGMVDDMFSMFREAIVFNQDLNLWDTQNVETMGFMFRGATAFDGLISGWNTGKVEDMRDMFHTATAFNQDIGLWNTLAVTNMQQMFQEASAFNQDIGEWDTDNVESMRLMFDDATVFDADIGEWNTGMVADMAFMFRDAASFNQDIGEWNTEKVVQMQQMFFRAGMFNQDIGEWDTGLVENMNTMFREASSFDQDLGGWDVTSLNDATNMFFNIALSTENYDSLLIGWDAQALINGVSFHGGDSFYCLGASARANMIDTDDWTIRDEGELCPNEPPTDIEIDGGNSDSILENVAIGSTIGTLTTTDSDAGDNHSYTLDCAVAGADDALFTLTGDELESASVFDFENPSDSDSDNIYEVCIVTTDDGDPAEFYEETITITVTNQQPDLSIVKLVDSEEPEVGDIVTFSLVISNLGGDDAISVVTTDIVPNGFTYTGTISGGDTRNDDSPAGTGLTWTIDSLAAGSTAGTLTFTASVNAP